MQIPEPLARSVRDARHVVALTGAGISAESGLPTFREAQTGLWARYRPEDLATPEAFARDPALVWNWYAWRRSLVRAAEPNAAHYALVRLAQHAARLTLITQNVDGLHRRAGSADVIELHGDVMRTKCSREGTVVNAVDAHPSDDALEAPPRCPRCGAYLRPDVVWFGEALPSASLETASEAAARCDVFLSIGTSGIVFPAASLLPLALESGAAVVVVNPEPQPGTDHERAWHLQASATEALPALVEAAWQGRGQV